MPREREPAALADLVEKVRPKGTLDDPHTARVLGAWVSVVPRRVAENARPVHLRRGVLVVHTATSAWSSVLSLEGVQILTALRARLPDVPVKKLLFRTGALPPMTWPAERPAPVIVAPANELPEDVARELARIVDNGVRASVARAAATGLGSRRPRR